MGRWADGGRPTGLVISLTRWIERLGSDCLTCGLQAKKKNTSDMAAAVPCSSHSTETQPSPTPTAPCILITLIQRQANDVNESCLIHPDTKRQTPAPEIPPGPVETSIPPTWLRGSSVYVVYKSLHCAPLRSAFVRQLALSRLSILSSRRTTLPRGGPFPIWCRGLRGMKCQPRMLWLGSKA